MLYCLAMLVNTKPNIQPSGNRRLPQPRLPQPYHPAQQHSYRPRSHYNRKPPSEQM